MKKASFGAFVATALLCYLFWLLITGQVSAFFDNTWSPQILIGGAVVSLLVALFAARFFIHKSAFHLLNPKHFFPFLLYCLVIFPWELIKANVDMALRAFGLKKIRPGIVKVPVKLKSEYGLAMLANSITLTPGTITMETVEDDGDNYFYIHWIDVAETDHKKAGKAIKGTMEKWLRRIWK